MKAFLRKESSPGLALIGAAIVGLVLANSPLYPLYDALLHFKIGLQTNVYGLHLTTHEWINDGLMAIFFLVVGMEIKREVVAGELSSFGRAALPAIAAIGGVIVPALICATFLWHDPGRLRGWAIPAATDIAFALAALALLGSAIPPALKIFLTALAVIDDLIAIIIIAIFYTDDLTVAALIAAVVCFAVLVAFNRLRVSSLSAYIVVGVVMWFCVLESGIHATLAGVALALTIPLALVEKFEHALTPYVKFLILPLFGLFNAGISFQGLSLSVLLGSLPLGVACGLFFGKQIGIFAFSWFAVKARIARLPPGVSWLMMYGVALLGGIGFTMSLFIGSLAFESDALLTETKLGVFAGSILAALCGYLVLRRSAAA